MISEAIRVLELEGQAILACARRLEKDASAAAGFTQAVDCLRQALQNQNKIIVTGIGKSGKIGQKIASTLCSTGSLAVYLHPTEGLHGDLGLIRPGDAVLALSYTGNTEEVVRMVPLLRNRGATVIGLGGNSESQLAQLCDAWIDAAIEQEACPHNLAPTTSTTLALALGDALAVALMQLKGFDAQAFAQNHPGGSLGKKLNLKTSDLLIPLAQVGVVTPEASMEEIISVSTQKPLGGVLVISGKSETSPGTFEGVITDGDIRRSLRHREKFFDFKAKDIMTARPVVAKPETPALESLNLMENRPSQISVLPVLNSAGACVGLLRLHDLARAF